MKKILLGMKKILLGITILLFSILFQMVVSPRFEAVPMIVAVVGLGIAFSGYNDESE